MKRGPIVFGWMLVACGQSPNSSSNVPVMTPATTTNAPATASAPSEPTPAPSASAAPPPSATPVASTPARSPEPSPVIMPPTKKTYSLVVSFGSPGNGTDHEAAKRLEAIMKTQKVVVHERGHWGKEGEHDECYDLGSMPNGEQLRLVARLKLEVESGRTRIQRDVPCHNDR